MNVEPVFKEFVACPCGCGVEGQIAKGTGHVRKCPNTCPKCRAGRNRRKGMAKQRVARKLLGVPDSKVASALSNEEAWRHAFRWEVKAGKQVGPAATRILAAEKQRDQNKALGDSRPGGVVLMPEGMSDGWVCVRLSVWQEHIAPLIEEIA